MIAGVCAAVPASVAAAEPRCGEAWTQQYSPGIEPDDLPTKVAAGRRADFSFNDGDDGDSAHYRPDLRSAVSITVGEDDPNPFFEVFDTDLRRESFYIEPERREIGDVYTVGASWAEDNFDPDSPCRRSSIHDVRVVRGLRPKVKIRTEGDEASFKVLQRRRNNCAQTRPGSIRISVRGPDAKRQLRLSDTCGRWSRRQGGAGWTLSGLFNYDRTFEREYPPEATLAFRYRTPGTRKFRYRVTFRGKKLESGRFDIRVRVCQFGVCRG